MVCAMTWKRTVLTGDRPTGKLHIGHYVGSLRNRVQMQTDFEVFVLIADMQALTDNARTPQRVSESILEVARDYLCAGIQPTKATIVIQSMVPELAELYMYLSNLVGVGRVERNPTVKSEIQQKGMSEHVPAGFFMYPISQSADILGFGADVVPVGADQAPMIELTNEIVGTFSNLYAPNVLKPVQALIPKVGRLPAPDGRSKMSKTLGNVLGLDASDREIEKFVNSLYPGMDGRQIHQPGVIEGNVILTYLDAFDPDANGLAELKLRYGEGGVGDAALKRRLLPILIDVISPMRELRHRLEGDSSYVQECLIAGSERGRARAAEILSGVKRAMGLQYLETILRPRAT
jgi:tryptophanyl-tRNA synthetase